MFKKEKFLKESKEMFLKIFNESKIESCMDYTDILDEVISFNLQKYNNDDILKEITYDRDFLNSEYEIAEGSEEDYCDGKIIKNYKDAVAYYSLNQFFNENYSEELEKLFLL